METQHIFRRAREAARALNRTASERIDRLLLALADAVEAGTEELLAANARDRSRMNPADPAYDRLLLDRGRLLGIAADLRNVAALPSPLGRILDRTVRPNGMEIRKVSVPFGVVGVIYEARPNVGFDVFALCVKSGNACILKGGSDARDSNAAIAALIRRTLAAHGFDENTLALLPPTHEATAALLGATGLVDLVIPRGGRGLIDFVRDHARVPVIETGAGVCHAYFDRSGDTEKGAAIVLNAKTRRVSVCNALDTLVVHRDRLTCRASAVRWPKKGSNCKPTKRHGRRCTETIPQRCCVRPTQRASERSFSPCAFRSARSPRSTRRSPTSPATPRSTARRS